MPHAADLAWKLQLDLRGEILSSQRIRAQVIGFKITFVSGAIALIATNLSTVSAKLLVIPALAAVFFDLLINSYSISIKRISYYSATYLEPKLREHFSWPSNEPLWHEFMSMPGAKQRLSLIGNLGITILAFVPAGAVLVDPFTLRFSLPFLLLLVLGLGYDLFSFFVPRRVAEGSMKGMAHEWTSKAGEVRSGNGS